MLKSASTMRDLTGLGDQPSLKPEDYVHTTLAAEIERAAREGRTQVRVRGPNNVFVKVYRENNRLVPVPWGASVIDLLRKAGYDAQIEELEERGIITRCLLVSWSK